MANQFNILDYTDGPLLKTGQTVEYTPPGRTTHDDGGFQRGIAGSKLDGQYVILTDGQYTGTTNITVNGFTDAHTNECVFDKVTGLMWNRELSDNIYGTGAQDLEWDNAGAGNEDVFEYCDQANLSNLSGFNDWEVPNILQCYSLVVNKGPAPIINSTAFPIWTTSNIYSSSTRQDNTNLALLVDFTFGTVGSLSKTNVRLPVPLVRLTR